MDRHALMGSPPPPNGVPAVLHDCTAARQASAKAQLESSRWLVPIDGTPASMAAVDYVISHADSARTHIHLVNVQPPIMTGEVSVIASAELVGELRRSAGRSALREATALLDRYGVQHSYEVVFGAVASAIVRAAAEHGCSNIVMAARRRGFIAKVVGGSVSSRVVSISRVPVTIVKAEPVQASS